MSGALAAALRVKVPFAAAALTLTRSPICDTEQLGVGKYNSFPCMRSAKYPLTASSISALSLSLAACAHSITTPDNTALSCRYKDMRNSMASPIRMTPMTTAASTVMTALTGCVILRITGTAPRSGLQ